LLILFQALLKLAKDAAGCEVDPPEGETVIPDCHERIYGIKPSSLLSTIGTIVDVVSASFMPLCGAIVDTTKYRRLFGRIFVSFFCCFLFISIFVSENTWFAIAILQTIWGFTVWFQNMVTYSYLPDLTDDQDIMREFTRSFAALSYGAMILYMASVTGIRAGLGYLDEDENRGSLDDEIKTAQLSQSISFCVASIGLTVAWGFLFQARPVLRPLQQGKSLWSAGFYQVAKTVKKINSHHIRLKWFYISVMFCDPAMMALTILSITFLTDQLQFSAQENGTAMLIMMVCAIPGTYVGSWFIRKFDAVISSMIAVLVLIATTTAVSIILKGPGQQTETYILAAGWGVGTGWKWMCDRMVLLLVLPPGQNAELMGVYVFFRQVIAWLPKLVFTVLNEKDISQRIGLATLNAYFVLGLASLGRLNMLSNFAPVTSEISENGESERLGTEEEAEAVKNQDEQSATSTAEREICDDTPAGIP